jgi:hypothetical protein
MIAWWAGEGDATDSRGDHDGTLQNGTAFAAGMVGQAFRFDGVDDEIQVPHAPEQNAGGQLTIDAWMYRSTAGHGRTILQKRAPGNVGGYMLETTDSPHGPSDGMQFFLWIGGTANGLISPAGVVSLGVWQHVAATYDGTTMRIYVNGSEVASTPMTGTIDPLTEPLLAREWERERRPASTSAGWTPEAKR